MPPAKAASYNPFDPIQDTESPGWMVLAALVGCYNPFDPIQDTESHHTLYHGSEFVELQPIRSDTGY